MAKLKKNLLTFLLPLLLLLLGPAHLVAQLTPSVPLRFVIADPAGACTARSPLQYNTLNGKLWGCDALTWTQISGGGGGGTPGAPTGAVQFNNAGAFAGNAGMTFDPASGALKIGANYAGTDAPAWYELGPSALVSARKNIGVLYGAYADTVQENIVDNTYCTVANNGCAGFYYNSMTGYNSMATPVSAQLGEMSCAGSYTQASVAQFNDCSIQNLVTGKYLYFIDTTGAHSQTGNTEGTFYLHNVSADGYMREALHTPASSSEACLAGQFADDTGFHYVCTATNTWKRVALSSF